MTLGESGPCPAFCASGGRVSKKHRVSQALWTLRVCDADGTGVSAAGTLHSGGATGLAPNGMGTEGQKGEPPKGTAHPSLYEVLGVNVQHANLPLWSLTAARAAEPP